VRLSKIDPGQTGGFEKNEGKDRARDLEDELGELQELLYAAQTHSLLVVLQGMDTSGKDGTIRKVFRDANPQGCRVTSFKVPTPLELDHDFLWRIHRETPERGMIGIFNRSHYEDVVVVRVKDLVPKPVWRSRYDQINGFERLLVESNTLVAKFYLHISKEEQEQRLLAREQEVEKAWKLNASDWIERESWDDYIAAYEDALTRCNSEVAPWHIIPADHKWFRDIAVTEVLVNLLRPLRDGWLTSLQTIGKQELAKVKEVREKQVTG
jgi:PPK2 family polyphosphate:nucleotide phosphotransferase